MASAANKQKCQPGTPTLGFESSFFEGGVIPSHLLFFYKLPIFVFERTVVENRLKDKNFRGDIEEVYTYEKGSVRLLFKKKR